MMVTYVISVVIGLGVATLLYRLARLHIILALFVIMLAMFIVFCVMPFTGGLSGLFISLAYLVLGTIMLSFGLRARTFSAAGAAAAIAMSLFVGMYNLYKWQSYAEEYPLVSMRDRLSYESALPKSLAIASRDETSKLNRFREVVDWRDDTRQSALKRIHSATVDKFVDTPGFGVGRMRDSIAMMEETDRRRKPVPQPTFAPEPLSAGASTADIPLQEAEHAANNFIKRHRRAQAEFVSTDSLGLVHDIDHVAGFEPHGFRTETDFSYREFHSKASREYTIVRLELVSLLKHDPPKVYVSKNLPDMAALDEVATRPLDPFERKAIKQLMQEPSKLVAEPEKGHLRLLGGILAVEQCIGCHRAREGELLGAFSYELRPEKPPERAEEEPKEPVVF